MRADNAFTSDNFDSDRSIDSRRAARDRGDHAAAIKLTDESIADLTLRCTNLEAISVVRRHTGSIISLLQMNPKLCSVTLRSCPKVLRCIADLCPDISSITITEKASSTDLELFALNVPTKLKQLCLPDTNVDQNFLSPFFSRAPSLIELRLGTVYCDWVNLHVTCSNLVVFQCNVPHNNTVRTDFITNLSNVMPNVHTLVLLKTNDYLEDVVATLIENILVSFPRLRQLCSLREFESKLSIHVTAPLGQALASDTYLLEELYVDHTAHTHLHSTLQTCPFLHTLGLSSTSDNSKIMKYLPASVKRFYCSSWHCAHARGYAIFKNLHELELGNCVQLTDSALVGIARNCPQLVLLHIYYAPRVTLRSVLTVLKLCPQLRSLEYSRDSSHRNKKKDEAVSAVMELCLMHYPQLQHISL